MIHAALWLASALFLIWACPIVLAFIAALGSKIVENISQGFKNL